jgi:hypothetical protein
MKALVDNDVLFKGLSYDLLDIFLRTIPKEEEHVGVLGAARFVLADKIRKRGDAATRSADIQRLDSFLTKAEIVEPTEEERVLAAEFESLGQKLNVALDSGESQLCAILIERYLPLLLTGDKRAIVGLEQLLNSHARLAEICEKVECLEQIVLAALDLCAVGVIRTCVCSHTTVDKTLSICFGCSSSSTSTADIVAGLDSYIRALRRDAPHILCT